MTKGKRLNFFVKLTILAVICFCVANIIRLHSRYNENKREEAELLKERDEYQEAIDKLMADLEHEMDKDYIMRIAREKLNYYLPDEVIFYNDR